VIALTVNAGSSSLKLRLLERDQVIRTADLPPLDGDDARRRLHETLADWPGPHVVGHRFVHGGASFTEPVVVDDDVRRRLEQLTPLAPLHQPHAIAALDAVSAVFPGVPAVACFDTAFHATLNAAAATYPIPREWRERFAIRRYGFHGFAHRYASRRAASMVGRSVEDLRIVSCHLGSGASLAAVAHGRSVDTTMGFTALEGVVMATRAGTIDPGIILWMLDNGLSDDEVGHALQHESGLAAFVASGDMRDVEAAAAAGAADAVLALDVYVHRLVAEAAAMVAALGGVDVLTFSGGVGENSVTVRRGTAERLAFLGVAIDDERNRAVSGDGDISADGAPVRTLVIAAREDIEIARAARGAVTGN
jgi:acetate kinase